MPKIKTKRIAKKKLYVTAKGKVKRAQANTSHNTAKRAQKRMRHLRGLLWVDKSNMGQVRRMLPYSKSGK